MKKKSNIYLPDISVCKLNLLRGLEENEYIDKWPLHLKYSKTEYDRITYKLNFIIEFIASVYTIGLKCHPLIYKVCFACFPNRVTIALLCTFVPVKSKLQHPPRAYPKEFDLEGRNLTNVFFPGKGSLITTHRGWGIWSLASISCYESRWYWRGLIITGETAETNFDEFKGKNYGFVTDWLKTEALHKLCTVLLLKVINENRFLYNYETINQSSKENRNTNFNCTRS